jgi:hypothetical protein
VQPEVLGEVVEEALLPEIALQGNESRKNV